MVEISFHCFYIAGSGWRRTSLVKNQMLHAKIVDSMGSASKVLKVLTCLYHLPLNSITYKLDKDLPGKFVRVFVAWWKCASNAVHSAKFPIVKSDVHVIIDHLM